MMDVAIKSTKIPIISFSPVYSQLGNNLIATITEISLKTIPLP